MCVATLIREPRHEKAAQATSLFTRGKASLCVRRRCGKESHATLAAELLVYAAFAAYIKKNRSRPPSKLGAGSVLSDVRGSL